MSYPPLGDQGLGGDMHFAALAPTDGSIDWLCPSRFDSHTAFSRILHWERGGHFRIGPPNAARRPRQRFGFAPQEIDPTDGTHLGNYPRAFGHIGLIGPVINLARASTRSDTSD